MSRLTHCPTCTAVVNKDTVVWKEPRTGADAPQRPEDDPAATLEWQQHDYAPHCPNSHPLPLRVLETDVVIMSVVGPSLAGKSTLLTQLGREIKEAALSERGLRMRISRLNIRNFNDVYWQETVAGTPQAQKDEIRLASVFEVDSTTGDQPTPAFDLMVFDCGGEDVADTDQGTLRSRTRFLPMSDIVVFAIPPEALPGLPRSLRRSDQAAETEIWFQLAAEWVAVGMSSVGSDRRARTAVAMLTKCDRYQSMDGFEMDPALLRPRKLRGSLGAGLDETMASEQPQLFEFVQRAGGQNLLEHISEINNRVYLTAVSGVGGDVRPDGTREERMLGMGSNRALDPLLIALMRRGIGTFGPTVAAR